MSEQQFYDAVAAWAFAALLAAIIGWHVCELLAPVWRAVRRLTREGVNWKPKLTVRTRRTFFSTAADLNDVFGGIAVFLAMSGPLAVAVAFTFWEPPEEFIHAMARLTGEEHGLGEVCVILFAGFIPMFIWMVMSGVIQFLEIAWNAVTRDSEYELEIVEERCDLLEEFGPLFLILIVISIMAVYLFVLEWLPSR